MEVTSHLQEQRWYSSLYSRSVIHDDSVFFAQSYAHEKVTTEAWSASWYAPNSIIDTVVFGRQKTEIVEE